MRFGALLSMLLPVASIAVAQQSAAPPSHKPQVPLQPPPESLRKQIDQPPAQVQDNSHTDRRGTVEAPLIVEMNYPPKTEQQAAENATEEERKASTDRWTIRLTVALVSATLLQFLALGYQGYWLRRTVRTAERTANAIEGIERPYFVLEKLSDFTIGPESVHRVFLTYAFMNLGRTPALVDDLQADFHYSSGAPPKTREYQFRPHPRLRERTYRAGDGFTEDELVVLVSGLNFIHHPLLVPNIEPDQALYLIMRARYRDVAGRMHETGVCRIYDIGASAFIRYEGHGYNYET